MGGIQSARTLCCLLEREDEFKKMAVAFRHLLELMKNWNEDASHRPSSQGPSRACASSRTPMRPLDLIRNAVQGRRDQAELRHLHDDLRQHAEGAEEKRDELCAAVVAHALDLSPDDAVPPVARAAWQLCQALLAYEGHLHVPDIDPSRARGTAETWELKAELARALRPFEEPQTAELIGNALAFVVKSLSDGVPAVGRCR